MTNTKYQNIINSERPEPIKPRMELSDRAKIFSPFAALKGYEEKIEIKDGINMCEEDMSLEHIRELEENY